MLTDEQIEALVVWKGDPKDPHYSRVEHARAIEAETLKAHQQAIEAAVLAEREACKEACAQLSKQYRDAYKGRTNTCPDMYYNPHIDGMSDGATNCEDAIRARTQSMRIDDAHKEDGP